MPTPLTMFPDPWMAGSIVVIGLIVVARMRNGGIVSRWRLAALAGALAGLALCWLSPLETLAVHYLLSAHVIQLTLVVGVIPALLLLAIPPGSPPLLSGWARRPLRAVTHPAMTIVLLNVALFGVDDLVLLTHTPVDIHVYDAAQLGYLGIGLGFWMALVDPSRHRTLPPMGRLFVILLVAIPQTFGGLLLALSQRSLYPGYGHAPRVLVDAASDQRIAGLVLALAAKAGLLVAFAVILVRLMNETGEEDEEDDDDDGGSGIRRRPEPAPPGRPEWLRHLETGRLRPEPAPARRRPPPVPLGR